MVDLVAVPLDEGGVIVVEMDHAQAGVVKAGRAGQIVGTAAQSLEAALESVAPAAQSILAKLRQARAREITVEFGLMLTAEAGAVIAKTASGCHLKVTLRWDRDDDAAG
ncbi:MAG: CU044_2847 family protein [Pseudonocardiaceae bacterium]